MTEIKIKTPVTDTGIDDEGKAPENTGDAPVETKPKTDDAPDDKPDDTPPKTETEEVIVVDDVEYTLNENGDALDKDGNVFKTKEELEELEKGGEDDDDPTGGKTEDVSIEDIEKLSGIEIHKDGKKVDYDISIEGLAKREQDIKEKFIKEGQTAAINEFFNTNPDLYKAYLYKSKKGSLDGFSNEPFYQSVKLDQDNEEQLFNFIVDAEVKKGSTPDRAKSIAKFFKAENKLQEEGESAYNYLVNLEKSESEGFKKQEQKQIQERIKREKEFFGTYFDETGKEIIVNVENSVYDKIVKKGKFGNFAIPESGLKVKNKDGTIATLSRKEVYDYVSKPVSKEGYTQAQVDEMNRMGNMDSMLYQYLLNMTNNDINQFIQRKILEEKGKTIKKRLSTKSTASQPHSRSQDTGKKIKLPVQ